MYTGTRSAFLSTVATVGLAGIIVAALPAQSANATSYQTLYSFQGYSTDGAIPDARLTPVHGILFGTTTTGGTGSCSYEGVNGCGTVFSIDPKTGAETVIYNFQGGSDGAAPFAHLIYLKGTLYGTTAQGGSTAACGNGIGCGTIFALQKTKSGWTETVLYAFTGGSDGSNPYGGLVPGSGGVLYGTTNFGGDDTKHCNAGADGIGCGVVFALTPPAEGETNWTESVLHTFEGGTDGANPESDLVMDSTGTLYGTTFDGGNSGCSNLGCGTVFTLAPSGDGWTESVTYVFQGGTADGSNPTGPLLLGKRGVIYGTTETGGTGSCTGGGCGTVYEATSQGESVIYDFQGGSDSWYPTSGVVRGKHGVLYGTADGYYDVGTSGNRYGTIFELVPKKAHKLVSWTYNLVHGFGGSPDGRNPWAGLTEYKGAYYGTTGFGGSSNPDDGTVFALTP